MSPSFEKYPSLFIIFNHGPFVVAKKLSRGHAVFSTKRSTDGHSSHPFAIGESVATKELLGGATTRFLKGKNQFPPQISGNLFIGRNNRALVAEVVIN